ncbi:MAG: hypothetical protein NTY81_04110 [Candidatus Staskawiczbacteria bacterium]|nr:hypothetical protein [Candidatus Staskawiczbacteria bacterium]
MTKKETAISLRQKGKTCGEIVTILNTPKSTIWSWIKKCLPLRKNQKRNLK